jgi:glyoxylase I family protein
VCSAGRCWCRFRIAHEPIKDIGPAYILEFRDPDNIALELTAPK